MRILMSIALFAVASSALAQPGSVVDGVVRDADSEQPVAWVSLSLARAGTSSLTLDDGSFRFVEVPAGNDTLIGSRIGYEQLRMPITVVAGDSLHLDIFLHAQAVRMQEIQVSGRAAEQAEHSHGDQTVVGMSGRDLRERMGSTLASTLSHATGVHEESMGAAPARPVVRGLSGQRLLLFEDGLPAGDLSASSPDHAVAIDPLGAQRLEVIRGPATLMYGSSVQGGVINVQRDNILSEKPYAWGGSLGLVSDSVNEGRAAQARVEGALGSFALVGNGTFREASNLDTPVGELGNSGIDTWNASAGISNVGEWGHVGLAARRYESDYGIPGGFLGGHPNGADIELEQSGFDFSAAIADRIPRVELFELRGRSSRYFHRELESDGTCGVSFGLLEYHGTMRGRFHASSLGHTSLGLSAVARDYAQGCLAFVPQTDEVSLGGFAYHEAVVGRFDIHGSVRFDNRSVQPSEERDNKAGQIRDRSFSGTSAAISAATSLGHGLSTRLMLLRSFRAPSLEELFSDGPHLASFAYEVGNADLDSEVGQGAEWTLRWDGERSAAWLALFHNDYSRFIHVADTGEFEFGPGEEGFLQRWQFRSQPATLSGAEFEYGWRPNTVFEFEFATSYVRGELSDLSQPLPRIPPLTGRIGSRLHLGAWHLSALVRGASEQTRLAEFEDYTAGYVTADASIEWTRLGGHGYQSIMLRVQNIADSEYRNHLSRIKSIMPQPGRNISLLVRLELF